MAQIYHHIFPKKQQQTDFAEAEEIKFLERAHDGKTTMTIDETEGTANATTDLAKNEKAIAPTPPPSPLADDVGKEIPENEMCTLHPSEDTKNTTSFDSSMIVELGSRATDTPTNEISAETSAQKEEPKEEAEEALLFANDDRQGSDDILQREHDIGVEFQQMMIKIDKDAIAAAKKQYQLDELERETHSIARELAHMQKKEQKEENAKMGQLKRIEEKAVKLAAKVADMQKAERDREAKKIARILECEKEARQVAAFLVDTYADDRKIAERELATIEEAEKRAHEIIQNHQQGIGAHKRDDESSESQVFANAQAALEKLGAEAALKKLGAEKRDIIARITELTTLESNARRRAEHFGASCLIELPRKSIVNVFEHKRYETDESEISVRPVEEKAPTLMEQLAKFPMVPLN